jgi:hypothetical protein
MTHVEHFPAVRLSLALLVILTSTAPVIPAAAEITSRTLDIAGEVVNTVGPCQEPVQLAGTAHVLISIPFIHEDASPPSHLRIDLAEVTGEGRLTGMTYLVAGAFVTVMPPRSPSSRKESVTVMASFAWYPQDACRVPAPEGATLLVPFTFTFDAADNLTPVGTLAAIAVPNFIVYRNK